MLPQSLAFSSTQPPEDRQQKLDLERRNAAASRKRQREEILQVKRKQHCHQ
jgi:hypothetical protein